MTAKGSSAGTDQPLEAGEGGDDKRLLEGGVSVPRNRERGMDGGHVLAKRQSESE